MPKTPKGFSVMLAIHLLQSRSKEMFEGNNMLSSNRRTLSAFHTNTSEALRH
jgi:hypothetical protein